MSLSAVIVDDEQLARDELAYLLKDIGDVDVVAQGKNGVEAVNLIREHSPDLVFLDVQMPGLDGFGVIKKLLDKKIPLPKIVFRDRLRSVCGQGVRSERGRLSAEALRPQASRAVPAKGARKDRGGGRFRRQVRSPDAHAGVAKATDFQEFCSRPPAVMFLINQKDICFASIEDGVITVVTSGASGMEGQSNCRTLEELLDSLDPNLFWRAHRSFLVNINRIREVVPWFKSSIPAPHGRQEAKRNSRKPRSNQTPPRTLRPLIFSTSAFPTKIQCDSPYALPEGG